MTITMHIEDGNGIVRQHPFHLGTDLRVARTFAVEKINRDDVRTVALRQDGKTVAIYDFRDRNDYEAA